MRKTSVSTYLVIDHIRNDICDLDMSPKSKGGSLRGCFKKSRAPAQLAGAACDGIFGSQTKTCWTTPPQRAQST